MSLSGIGIALLALSNCFIKNQSDVMLLLFSLKLNSIAFTSVPPVDTEIEILAFKLKSGYSDCGFFAGKTMKFRELLKKLIIKNKIDY
jgi:hypothetical protein